MYQDHGYGENWQPTTANNARRINPYTNSFAILGCFFAIGFILIVIVVLSLIPVYISRSTVAVNKNLQVAKLTIRNYQLEFLSPSTEFNPDSLLSDKENRENLQAALTSIVQNDRTIVGSIIQIDSSRSISRRKREQLGVWLSVPIDISVISSRPCTNYVCLHSYQDNVNAFLTDVNRSTTLIRYHQIDLSDIFWLHYRLPQQINSTINWTSVDPESILLTLEKLIFIDKTRNQQTNDTTNSTMTESTLTQIT